MVWTWAYGFCTDVSFNGTITYTTEGATLTITYQTTNGPVEKKGAIKITGKDAQKIAEEIKKTAKDPDAPPNAETYYKVIHPKTKINYFFKLDSDQASMLTTGAAAITGPVTVQYGHVFAEGFGNLEDVKPS